MLTVDSLDGWFEGAGVGIAGAAGNGAALVTRVISVDSIKKVLNLKDAAIIGANSAMVTSG